MTKFLIMFASCLFFLTCNATEEQNLEDSEELNLSEDAVDYYSPYSYKANCSYLFDPGCGGSVYNPAANNTTYTGYRSGGYGHDDYRHGRKGNGNGYRLTKLHDKTRLGLSITGHKNGGRRFKRR
jgi:hypothetical protein